MASFAKISENNEVLTVIVLNDSDMFNAEGVETETVGQQYLETHNNWPAHLWIQILQKLDGNHQSVMNPNLQQNKIQMQIINIIMIGMNPVNLGI